MSVSELHSLRGADVNRYAHYKVRLMANYVDVESERRGVAGNPGTLLMRAQVSF